MKPGGAFMINCQWTPEELEHHPQRAEAKRYITPTTTSSWPLSTPIDLAAEIGMGKHGPCILQSAFFTLANDPTGQALST